MGGPAPGDHRSDVPQVLKADVRRRIVAAGEDVFFERGFDGATMTDIARRADVGAASIYRYFPDKEALFEAVVPDELIAEHDRLLDERIAALVEPVDASPTAGALLDFWVAHHRAVAMLLDNSGSTSRSAYAPAFVARLSDHVVATLDRPPTTDGRAVLDLVFDNTRRALSTILRATGDDARLRVLIAGFWSYQLPGLDGLVGWLGDVTPAASSRRRTRR